MASAAPSTSATNTKKRDRPVDDEGLLDVASTFKFAAPGSSLKASLTEPHPSCKDDPANMTKPWSIDADASVGIEDYTHLWLYTKDMDGTLDFYVRKLGFKLSFRYENHWAELLGPGDVRLGFESGPGFSVNTAPVKNPGVSVCIGTLDLDKSIKTLKARGVDTFDDKNIEAGPVVMRNFKDPNGYSLTLLGNAAPAKGKGDSDEAEGASAAKKQKKPEEKSGEGKWKSTMVVEAKPPTNANPMTPWDGGDEDLAYNAYGNITLSSKDFAATRVFWGKLNFKMIYIMGDQWMEMLGPGNVRLGFSPPYGGKCESEANHFIGVGCTDVGKSHAILGRKGMTGFKQEPTIGPMTVFTLQDPDGNRMAIVGKTQDATGIEKPAEGEKPKST